MSFMMSKLHVANVQFLAMFGFWKMSAWTEATFKMLKLRLSRPDFTNPLSYAVLTGKMFLFAL
jgi:hypothetical protein